MTTQNKNVPALRFPEYVESWENKRLREIANIYDGIHQTPKYVSEGVKFVSVENIEDIENTNKFITKEAFEKDFKTKPQINDILMTRITAGIIGATAIVKNNNPLAYYVSLALIRSKTNADTEFLNQRINSHQFKHELHKRIIHVAFPKKINLGEIGECEASLPTLPEQQKIAAFLTAVDERIQQLAKKKDLWEQYKKGVMQKIFNQEIRFKDDNGKDFADWKEMKGNEVFDSISDKKHNSDLPILAITQEYGAIPRDLIDYQISVTDKSVESYKVVEAGDFIISLRSFQGGIEYSNYKGICSPAYIILRSKVSINNLFYKYYLKTDSYIQKMNAKLEGIRDGKMVSYKYFSEINLPFPSIEEQNKIADFFTTIDKKINSVNQQLEKTKEYKKGLLQQMFI